MSREIPRELSIAIQQLERDGQCPNTGENSHVPGRWRQREWGHEKVRARTGNVWGAKYRELQTYRAKLVVRCKDCGHESGFEFNGRRSLTTGRERVDLESFGEIVSRLLPGLDSAGRRAFAYTLPPKISSAARHKP